MRLIAGFNFGEINHAPFRLRDYFLRDDQNVPGFQGQVVFGHCHKNQLNNITIYIDQRDARYSSQQ